MQQQRDQRCVSAVAGLTNMFASGLSGVYSAPKGMTAFVASMRLLGHTFQDSLMPSFSSSSRSASDMAPAAQPWAGNAKLRPAPAGGFQRKSSPQAASRRPLAGN